MMERLAEKAVAGLIDRLAETAAAELPDLAIERRDDGVLLRGPGLTLRRLTDARLRGLGPSAVRR